MFTLHERLQADTVSVTRLKLCRVLWMNDASFPWLILVPERPEIREVHQLSAADRSLLIEEIAFASRVLETLFHPDKINVGALGNLVPQLHLHIIARFRNDRAWPGPVWGTGLAQPYPEAELKRVCERVKKAFNESV